MTNTIKDYILPVFLEEDYSTFRGTAFCINNYIITAGHVAPHLRSYVTESEGSFFSLDPSIKGSIPFINKDSIDLTAYKIENLPSPLSLADKTPNKGTILKLIFWQNTKEGLIQCECNCKIEKNDTDSSTFSVITDKQLHHGSSGCPIFKNNKVYGILTKGSDPNDIPRLSENGKKRLQEDIATDGDKLFKRCVILKSTEILKKISQNIYNSKL